MGSVGRLMKLPATPCKTMEKTVLPEVSSGSSVVPPPSPLPPNDSFPGGRVCRGRFVQRHAGRTARHRNGLHYQKAFSWNYGENNRHADQQRQGRRPRAEGHAGRCLAGVGRAPRVPLGLRHLPWRIPAPSRLRGRSWPRVGRTPRSSPRPGIPLPSATGLVSCSRIDVYCSIDGDRNPRPERREPCQPAIHR
jgi:hypothetical protein